MSERTHPLTQVGAATTLEVGVGHMLLNVARPSSGAERGYTRWYEDDHFFSAAMMAPFVFSGRRWVAPQTLAALHYGRPGGEFDPPPGGTYAATYWIAPGHLNDYLAWSAGTGPQLDAQGRNFTERQLTFVSFADRISTVYRDAVVPRDIFSLVDPAGGLIVQLIDAAYPEERDAVAAWLTDEFLPERLAADDNVTDRVIVFRGTADTSGMRPALQEVQRRSDHEGRRLVLLWFLDRDPREGWEKQFASVLDGLATSRHAVIEWSAAFVPAHMGTDDYVDILAAPAAG